jgi:hypothetical protein
MPKGPLPRGARQCLDVRPRVLAALTPEPSTATEIAERAGLPGRERAMHATRALVRLEADGLAFSELRRNITRWRAAQLEAMPMAATDPTQPLGPPPTLLRSGRSSDLRQLRLGVATGPWPSIRKRTFRIQQVPSKEGDCVPYRDDDVGAAHART